MLEMSKLHLITMNDLESAINNTIKEKIFVRRGIQKDSLPDLSINEQLNAINNLMFNNKNYYLIKTLNNIEWTPEKLYQSAYYMIYYNNNYWIASHSSHEGFLIKFNISLKDYITFVFHYVKPFTQLLSLDNNYWPKNEELFYSYTNLKKIKNDDAILIKKNDYDNDIKINHFLYKIGNKIYYLPISNKLIYKPILYFTLV